LIIPGGNYIKMAGGLNSQTATNIHNAVGSGLNYLGICAGGLLAGSGTNQIFNLTGGVRFDFYTLVNRGIHKAAVPITRVEGATLEHYWEDGPQLSGWGAVVARYPDGMPAVAQGHSGRGWVILCGMHPEAPEDWRQGMTFKTPAREDNAYAAELIHAALEGKSLPHY
jgi:glutamine amidotransferase-like uncharacterized protein